MGVGLGPGHIALHGDPAPLKRGTVAPLPAIFGPCLLWPNGWMDQDATTEVDLDPCHIVVDGAQLPRKGAQHSRLFGLYFCAKRSPISATGELLYKWSPKNGSPYPIGPYCPVRPVCITLVYCGQTAGWIRRQLGMEIGLDPGHIALDGDPAPHRQGHSSPLFCNLRTQVVPASV